MTRYTNISRKRTYLQASFDPKNDQVATTNVASTPVLGTPDVSQFQHEGNADAPVKSSSCKRRRKSKGDSEEKAVVKSQKTKKAPAKLKAKEKAKRVKCTGYFFFYFIKSNRYPW
jgi:hypothetical protein